MFIKNKSFLLLGLLIFIAILIRTIHFPEYLNFSHDQGDFSLKAFELYQAKSVVLIGPSTSFIWNGHEFYQGSVIYYMFLLFLLPTNFDPMNASYLFMIFAVIMIAPLFLGVKYLLNEKSAYLISVFYAFLPLYIDYTKFLWNPNFQFALLPVLIFLMGMYQKYKSKILFLLIGACLGFLLMFHYQFALIILGIMIYYFVIKKEKIKLLPLLVLGLAIGFFPIILFELRNNFYNLRTILLILPHLNELHEPNSILPVHYFLSIALFALIIIMSFFKRFITYPLIISIGLILFFYSLVFYSLKLEAFNNETDLKYQSLQKIAIKIKKDAPSNFNIVDQHTRDNQAAALRYLLTVQGVLPNSKDDYNSANTLYIYSKESLEDLLRNPIYEIKSFLPYKKATSRRIDNQLFLYTLTK